METNEVIVHSIPANERYTLREVTTTENTGVVTILEHNLVERRVSALVHLGDKVVKIKKRRDRGLDHETGLQDLLLELAKEDVVAKRADVVWSLGEE